MSRILILTTPCHSDVQVQTLSAFAAAISQRSFTVEIGVLGKRSAHLPEPGTLPLHRLWDWRGYQETRKVIARFEPDIIHAIGSFAAQIAGLLSLPKIGLTRRPKLIFSSSDDLPLCTSSWFLRRILRRADCVVASSQAELQELQQCWNGTASPVCISPAVTPNVKPSESVALRKSLDLPGNARIIVAPGAFVADSELRLAAWSFDMLKHPRLDAYLLMRGHGPDRARVERLIQRLAYDDNRIRILPATVSPSSLISGADIVWVPNSRGGQAIALAGMAAGKPVVVSRIPELLEIVENGINGRTFSAGQLVELATVTLELLEDPEQCQRLGDAAKETVAKQFSLEMMAERYSTVYHKVSNRVT